MTDDDDDDQDMQHLSTADVRARLVDAAIPPTPGNLAALMRLVASEARKMGISQLQFRAWSSGVYDAVTRGDDAAPWTGGGDDGERVAG